MHLLNVNLIGVFFIPKTLKSGIGILRHIFRSWIYKYQKNNFRKEHFQWLSTTTMWATMAQKWCRFWHHFYKQRKTWHHLRCHTKHLIKGALICGEVRQTKHITILQMSVLHRSEQGTCTASSKFFRVP